MNCAPGILALLAPLRGGTVLELGCGTGLLTRHLVDAGYRVIATDASEDMLEHARAHVPEADVRPLRLPDDPLPRADAVVSIGNVLNYLTDADAVVAALEAASRAVRPGGILAVDLCDLAWGEAHRNASAKARLGDGWAMITRFAVPRADRFLFDFTIFTECGDFWRRDDERHELVLVDAAEVAARTGLAIGRAFGTETLPAGMVALTNPA
ncbi:Trans-aconitate 2-methyltransferase [Amycolatopsis sp. CA-230715]|nr:Trans-aconitate 2-methyltransferase [Amycolatopsis sp. CA-230715]